MTVYILALVRDVLCLIIIIHDISLLYRALSHYYNSTEISHLTSYPQTSSSNNREHLFFFRDGINGDGMMQCVVFDNQIGVKT